MWPYQTMPIYEWDSAATWNLFVMIACIKLVFPPQKNVQSLSRRMGEIPMKLIWEQLATFPEIGKGHKAILNFCYCINMHSMADLSYCNLNDEFHIAYFDAAYIRDYAESSRWSTKEMY